MWRNFFLKYWKGAMIFDQWHIQYSSSFLRRALRWNKTVMTLKAKCWTESSNHFPNLLSFSPSPLCSASQPDSSVPLAHVKWVHGDHSCHSSDREISLGVTVLQTWSTCLTDTLRSSDVLGHLLLLQPSSSCPSGWLIGSVSCQPYKSVSHSLGDLWAPSPTVQEESRC